MEWYLEPFRKYAQFSGRARRREYFTFTIVNAIITSFLGMVTQNGRVTAFSMVAGLFALAIIIPGLAVTVRRLHDVGKSGLWWLINFIPLVGQIIFLIILLKDSNYGNNIYGPNPKGEG